MPHRTSRLLATALALALVALSLLRPFERPGEDYLDQALRNALVTFAVARVLNAGISVVQGTELAFSPAGVGVTLSPGEVLDPLNDLVERFSWVMLVAASSLGIQKLLLGIGASPQFSLLMAAALTLYLLALWHPRWREGRLRRAGFRLAAILVAVRFGMGLVLLGNELVYRQFIEPDYQQAAAGLEAARLRIEALGLEQEATGSAEAGAEEESLSQRMRSLWNGAGESLNPVRHLQALKAAAAEATDHIIRLIVVFLMQTLLLPLLFLWALYKSVAVLLAPDQALKR